MNKNSLFTKAIAGFLAVMMVFGALVSLRGFSIAKAEVVESAQRSNAKTDEPTRADANGVGHRVITQQVRFSEWKQKDKSSQSMELFPPAASGNTYIGLWYDGTESNAGLNTLTNTRRVWLAQDQYKNPGAFQGISGGKIIEYSDPGDEQFYVTDENNYRGYVSQENFGPNKNWWLKTGTYYPANQTPWKMIQKIINVGTPNTAQYNQLVSWFGTEVLGKMRNEYANSRYFNNTQPSGVAVNGCAIQLNVYDPLGGGGIKWIGADVKTETESFGSWYKVTKWHTTEDEINNDVALFEDYLLPALVQCAVYAITSGNTYGFGNWPSSHEMNQNQKDPWNNTVGRREITRTMNNGSDSGDGTSSNSYTRMIVNKILEIAKNTPDNVPGPISYSMPKHEVGRNKNSSNTSVNPNPVFVDQRDYEIDSNDTFRGPNGEWYGYMGVFLGQPPVAQKVTVTFKAEFYQGIGSNGSLINPTTTPHTVSGLNNNSNFVNVTLKKGNSNVGSTPLSDGDNTPWEHSWTEQEKGGNYGITVNSANGEWIYLPGKTTTETDADGNVTITGRFLYNRTDVTIAKKWNGSTTFPSGVSATFQLKQNGNNYSPNGTTTLNSNKTSHTWTKLPKYITNGNTNLNGIQWQGTQGKEYVYTVAETGVSSGWNVDPNPRPENGSIVFNNTSKKITVTIIQEWYPNSTSNGMPTGEPTDNPQSFTNSQYNSDMRVQFNLHEAGVDRGGYTGRKNGPQGNWKVILTNQPYHAPADNAWQVPGYGNTKPEDYGWVNVPGATVITYDSEGNVTITLKAVPKKITVTVIQEWYTDVDASGNLYGKTTTPTAYSGNSKLPVQFNISKDGVHAGEATADKDANWTFVWPGQQYGANYDVTGYGATRPQNKPETYGWLPLLTYNEKTVDADGNVTIRVKALANRTDLTVRKQWKDLNGNTVTPDGASATFQLKKDGVNEGAAQTVSGSGSYTWTKLEKYKLVNGKPVEIAYTVEETAHTPAEFSNATQHIANGEIVVTNNEAEPTVTDVSVNKVWVNNTPVDITFPTSVTVKLQRCVNNNENWVNVETRTLTAEENWNYTWNDLPLYENPANLSGKYTYRVVETNVPEGYRDSVTKNSDTSFTITNTKLVRITITQEWYADVDENGNLINKVTNPVDYNGVNSNMPVTFLLNNGTTNLDFSIERKDNWTRTVGGGYNNSGWWDAATFSFAGFRVDNGVPNAPETYGWRHLADYVEITYDENGNVHVICKALANFIEKTVVKNWVDENKAEGLCYEPTSATVEFRKDGAVVETVELNAANEWTKSWTNLPKYFVTEDGTGTPVRIEYEVVETAFAVDGETVTEGFTTEEVDNGSTTTITNTRDQVTINITVENFWFQEDKDDEGNDIEWPNTADGYVPASIGYQLYANNEPVGEPKFLDNPFGGSSTWDDSAIWENLPKYDENGELIEYTIEVVDPDERWTLDTTDDESGEPYSKTSSTIEGVEQEDGSYKFKLVHRWSLVKIVVAKSWNQNGVDVSAPTDPKMSVTVNLYKYSADGLHELLSTLTLKAANEWKGQFTTKEFTNDKSEDVYFPRFYIEENGEKKLGYFIVEEDYDENEWTPVYPENYLGKQDGETFISYFSSADNGTFTWPLINTTTGGDYTLDKTAHLNADGTYTVTLTAQYNGPLGNATNPATFISDTLGSDFHVDSATGTDTHKDKIRIFTQEYLGKDDDGNDLWGDEFEVTSDIAYTTDVKDRGIDPGVLGTDADKKGLKVDVTGFDLEANGCYVDSEGAHGYRIVVKINKVLANGEALGDRLPVGDAPMNDIVEDRNNGICGIYKSGENEPMTAKLREGDELINDAKLIFPKPVVQIREIVQVYDFGLRQRNDDLLDFFGHGNEYNAGLGDIEHVLALDFMYKEQSVYHFTYPYVGADGLNADMNHITYTKDSIATEEFEAGLVTYYVPEVDENGNTVPRVETGWNDEGIWQEEGFLSHPKQDNHACFGYFEPKEISVREFTLAALIEISDGTYAWCKLIFVPATNVYYEAEDFLASDPAIENDFVADWSKVNENDTYSRDERYQNHSTGDLQHVYGYDDAYVDGHTGSEIDNIHTHEEYDAFGLSNGQALEVTLTAADVDQIRNGKKWPSVEFTFTGEGFELITSTNSKSGFIAVQVWDITGETEALKVTKYVDTRYFGANYEDGGETDYNNATGSLNQIPVLRIADLPNSTYKVRISAVYLKNLVPIKGSENLISIPGLEGKFEYESVYGYELGYATRDEVEYPDMTVELDAIRIFNPYAADRHVAQHMDAENNGAYESIKNVIRKSQLDPSKPNDQISGGIYVDYIHVTNESGEPIVPNGTQGYSLNDYLTFGPNNEMYLKSGNAFAFVVDKVKARQSIHLGAKTPTGTSDDNTSVVITGTIYGLDENDNVRYSREIVPMRVDSATPMYYSISDSFVKDNEIPEGETVTNDQGVELTREEYTRNLVVIRCEVYKIENGIMTQTEDNDAILSLTNIKVVNMPTKNSEGAVVFTRPDILGDTQAPNNGGNDSGTNNNVGVRGESSEDPAIIMTTGAYESAMAVICGTKGDVDGDRNVTMMDAILVMRAAVNAVELNNFGKYCADMNGSGIVDLSDAVLIVRKALGN